MEMYKSNPIIIDAIISAAIRAGSFKQLAAEISLPEMILTLITDAAMTELSKNTLEALMPKIREHLPGDEKNNILEFLYGPAFQREYLNIPATSNKEEHNG